MYGQARTKVDLLHGTTSRKLIEPLKLTIVLTTQSEMRSRCLDRLKLVGSISIHEMS